MVIIRFVVIVLAVTLFSSSTAFAQATGWIEVEQVASGDGVIPQVNVYAKGPIRGRLGWTLWAQSSRTWGETIGGLTFAPAKWVEVAGMVGLETDQDPFRYSGTVWVGKGKFSFLTIQESGGSGYWQKNLATVQLNQVFTVGLLQQTFVGIGPYVEAKSRRLTLWGAVTLDNPGMLTGIRIGI